jgi:hypothetical protein
LLLLRKDTYAKIGLKVVPQNRSGGGVRVMKNKQGGLILEMMKNVETLIDKDGATHFVYLPSVEEIAKVLPSHLLEDIYYTVNAELQSRDQKWIQEHL